MVHVRSLLDPNAPTLFAFYGGQRQIEKARRKDIVNHVSHVYVQWVNVIEVFASPASNIAPFSVLKVVINRVVNRSEECIAALVRKQPASHLVGALHVRDHVTARAGEFAHV
jgi:hypothetical protein